ncbi:MAG: hypothetical protein HYZ28_06485 [Myxococcales bacterium]|nr:hypothetical protein [Myxococcales bacterium]
MTTPPEPALAAVLARAFHRARAADANREIAKVRREEGGEGKEHLSYEILLPPTEPLRHLLEVVLPRMVYFLDCRGAKLPAAAGVFTSIFVGEEIFFVRAGDLLEELRRLAGLAPGEMVARWGAASV